MPAMFIAIGCAAPVPDVAEILITAIEHVSTIWPTSVGLRDILKERVRTAGASDTVS
jgi:hypothetical protein